MQRHVFLPLEYTTHRYNFCLFVLLGAIEDDVFDYRMRQFHPSMNTDDRHVLHSTGINNDSIEPQYPFYNYF